MTWPIGVAELSVLVLAVTCWTFGRWFTERETQRRAESVALAHREAVARDMREAARRDECYVVHEPEIYAGYCETHKRPVDSDNRCP